MAELNEIFRHTPDAVFAIDNARRIVYRNHAFTRMFQHYSPSASPHRKCYEVLCGRTLDGKKICRPDCPMGTSLVQGHPVENFDLSVPRDNGKPLWLSVGAIPAAKVFNKTAAIFMLRPIPLAGMRVHPVHEKGSATGGALTRRERQILDLLAQGLSARALARLLHIRYVTARNHIQHIYEKLDVHNRAEAVSYALRRTPAR